MTYIAKYGQSLLYIAIMLYGSSDAVVMLAKENNLSITEELNDGQEIVYSEQPVQQSIVNYFKSNTVVSAKYGS